MRKLDQFRSFHRASLIALRLRSEQFRRSLYLGVFLALFALAFIIYFFASSPWQNSANDAVYSAYNLKYDLNPQVEVFEDKSGILTIEDMTTAEYMDMFTSNSSGNPPSFSYTDSAVWVRFSFTHPYPELSWLFEISYPVLDKIDFYMPGENGQFVHKQGGDTLPYYIREIDNRYFVFEMPVSWTDDDYFYLRAKTKSAMILPMTLWESQSFLARASSSYFNLGLYYGLMLLIFLATLLLSIFIRSKGYLYYSFFIFSVGMFQLVLNGLAFQYLWPNHPWWGHRSINLFIMLAGFTAINLTLAILPIDKIPKQLYRIIRIVRIISLLSIPLTLIIDFTVAMQLAIIIVLLSGLLILVASLICYRRNYRPASFVFLGWLALTISVVLMSGRSMGLFPDVAITRYSTQIGFSFKLLFLLFGMADHMYILKKEKELNDKLNKEMEIERHKLKQAETLAELSREITAFDSVDSITNKLLVYISKLISFDYACALELKESAFSLLTCYGIDDKPTAKQNEEIIVEPSFQEILDSGQPRLMSICSRDDKSDASEQFRCFKVEADTQSVMIVPMSARKKKFGILVLESRRKDAFRMLDFTIVMNFSNHTSLTIENARLFSKINHMAITDELTGWYNRRYLFSRGLEEFSRAKRYKQPISMIMLDIDHFKKINDIYGHSTGDQVLQSLAHLCENELRESDLPCRYGGEEFVILLPEIDEDDAYKLAWRLRETIESVPISVRNNDVEITASFGVASLDDDVPSFEQLVEKADAALYEAKRLGRNTVV